MPKSILMIVTAITQTENRIVENFFVRSLYSTVLFAITILVLTFVSMGYHYIHRADATSTATIEDTTDRH